METKRSGNERNDWKWEIYPTIGKMPGQEEERGDKMKNKFVQN